MATKLLTINSIINFHPNYEDDACSLCSKSGNHRFAFHYEYATERVLDWMEDDNPPHGEALVCSRCENKFDPDVLMEV